MRHSDWQRPNAITPSAVRMVLSTTWTFYHKPWGIRLAAILWSFVVEAKFGLLLSSSYFIYLPIRLNTPDSVVPRTLDRTLRYNNKDCCCYQPFKFRNYVTFEFQLLILNYLSIFRYILTPEGDVRRVFRNTKC